MAEVIKFNLSGRTGFFKKPDVNTYLYFTYGSIHRVALLGILGSIMGYGGYNQQNESKTVYPEFYEKLKDLKVSIVPKNEKGYISKKVQRFNNSTYFFNKGKDENGANLIVPEQWLENPSWDIYILLEDNEVSRELKERLEGFRFEFIPYLGKNDHFANLSASKLFEGEVVGDVSKIDSYFLKNAVINLKSTTKGWKVEENLPVGLEEVANQYIYETMMATDFKLEVKDFTSLYKVGDKVLYFG